LSTLYLVSAKNTYSWHVRKGDLQCAFHLDILMVPSSVLTVTADGERLSNDVFSFSETICFESLKFIVDHFGGLSLSSIGDGSGTTIMGSTHGETHRGFPHDFGWRREDRPPLSLKA
jgi:hypothetical protein